MKMLTNILIMSLMCFIVLISNSCHKENDSPTTKCPGDDKNYVDTSLYISFNQDGVHKKYYQMYPNYFSGPGNYSIIYGTNVTICRNSYQIYFLGSSDKSQLLNIGNKGDICFTFHKSKPTTSSNMNSVEIPASDIFASSLAVSYDDGNYSASQTTLMDGYSLDLSKGGVSKFLSTDNVFVYYNQINQSSSIQTFFTSTNFSVSKVENLCNNCYIIEGTFNTKMLKKPDYQQDFLSSTLTEGKFRFISNILQK